MKDEMDFGFRLKEAVDDYSEHIGNYVRVYSNNNTFYGKMLGAGNMEFTQLKPSLIDYSSPNKSLAKIENKIPTTINTSSITAVQPVTMGLLEDICDGLKQKNEEIRNG